MTLTVMKIYINKIKKLMSKFIQVKFRSKIYELQVIANGHRIVLPKPIREIFLDIIGRECELSVEKFQSHAVFVLQDGTIFNDTSYLFENWIEKKISLHLSRVCSVCQIDTDIGAEFDGKTFTLFCGHTLHRACLEKMEKKNCPLCRDGMLQVQHEQLRAEAQNHLAQQSQHASEIQLSDTSSESFFVPKWSILENVPNYQILDYQATARPNTTGMFIVQSEPLEDNKKYQFVVQMNEEPYCAAALSVLKISPGNRNFGRDFSTCVPLQKNLGKKNVYMYVDMQARVAKYHFGDNVIETIENLPLSVYVICAVKHQPVTLKACRCFQ